jgi:hypothetical protein
VRAKSRTPSDIFHREIPVLRLVFQPVDGVSAFSGQQKKPTDRSRKVHNEGVNERILIQKEQEDHPKKRICMAKCKKIAEFPRTGKRGNHTG